VWRAAPTADVTLPPDLADRRAFPFAGRSKECDQLLDSWRAVADGTTRLVLVSGEPGIGKTRLSAHVAASVLEECGFVLAGRCDELVGAPYQPFADALRYQLGSPVGDELLGDAPGELVRLVPALADVVGGLAPPLSADPDAERLRLFDAVRSWLAQLASSQPVMLVLDDLHWADASALLLARHVVVTDPVPHLLVVGTYRDTDLDRAHPLAAMLGELRRRAEVSRIALEGLDAGEVTDFVGRAAGHELATDALALAQSVRDETGGNPFFVGEVLRHLAETGAIVEVEGRWSPVHGAGPLDLPEGIREVVGRRVSLLPDATQAALATASVVGAEFRLDLVAAVMSTDEDALLDALEPALNANLIFETGVGTFRFTHALVRSTLHSELSTTRRARLHRAVAGELERMHAGDLDGVVADLAYHWIEAGPAAAQVQAIAYARRAAEVAMAHVAPEEAARWYAQAREILDGADPHLDAELLCRLAIADSVAGRSGWQDQLLAAARAAEAVDDIDLSAEVLCVSRRSVLTDVSPEGASPEKIALLERAVERSGDNAVRTGRLMGALAVELLYTGDVERRAQLVEACQALMERVDDPVQRHRVWTLAGRAAPPSRWRRTDLERFMNEWSEAARRAVEAGDRDTEAHCVRGLFYTSMSLHHPRHHELLSEFESIVATFPDPYLLDEVLLMRMHVAVMDGELTIADEYAIEVGRQWTAHGRAGEAQIYSTAGLLQTTRERAGMGPLIEPLRAFEVGRPDATEPRVTDGLLAQALAEAGRLDESRTLIDERGANHFLDIPDDSARPVALPAWIEAASRTRHTDACQALRELVLPISDLHFAGGGTYVGAAALGLALLSDALGEHDQADAWFAQADIEHEEMATPPWCARNLVDWAESLARRGHADEARNRATRALAHIGELDLHESRARAHAVLNTT
jgi:tetratricopeptide (TPR) repeat protein